MMPPAKVPGTEHPADLMTKHLCESEVLKYMGMMRIELEKGRARIAAELHVVRTRRNGDSWDEKGKKGVWRRAHQSWRRTLFTPTKVAGGPARGGDTSSTSIPKQLAAGETHG